MAYVCAKHGWRNEETGCPTCDEKFRSNPSSSVLTELMAVNEKLIKENALLREKIRKFEKEKELK